eukprot:TRINITY_DN10543_c0_g2_i1.p1 TRINITY_DN10543_c0_g2~~TRINITY_DN10543_c0_g2_i1.p1  ORF type:complete len:160 (+),score=6.88 TRINITY_DN10543_c0_g2_i1:80-559(+)
MKPALLIGFVALAWLAIADIKFADPLKFTASLQINGYSNLQPLTLTNANLYQVNWDFPSTIESNSRATDAHICVSGTCCGDSGADATYAGACSKSNGTFYMRLRLECENCACSDRKFYFIFEQDPDVISVGDYTACFSLPAPNVSAVPDETVAIYLASP